MLSCTGQICLLTLPPLLQHCVLCRRHRQRESSTRAYHCVRYHCSNAFTIEDHSDLKTVSQTVATLSLSLSVFLPAHHLPFLSACFPFPLFLCDTICVLH